MTNIGIGDGSPIRSASDLGPDDFAQVECGCGQIAR